MKTKSWSHQGHFMPCHLLGILHAKRVVCAIKLAKRPFVCAVKLVERPFVRAGNW